GGNSKNSTTDCDEPVKFCPTVQAAWAGFAAPASTASSAPTASPAVALRYCILVHPFYTRTNALMPGRPRPLQGPANNFVAAHDRLLARVMPVEDELSIRRM